MSTSTAASPPRIAVAPMRQFRFHRPNDGEGIVHLRALRGGRSKLNADRPLDLASLGLPCPIPATNCETLARLLPQVAKPKPLR